MSALDAATVDALLHEAGAMGWPTSGSSVYYGTEGLGRARRWVEAHMANGLDVETCKAWLARAGVPS